MSITWKSADIPNAYGFTATLGDRTVEVLRAQFDQYHVFGRISGATMKQIPDSEYLPLAKAKKLGEKLLTQEPAPETWPKP